jgi:hypothetical protein
MLGTCASQVSVYTFLKLSLTFHNLFASLKKKSFLADIQSWWEVPSIAHFCSLFRAAFNLLDFDIEVRQVTNLFTLYVCGVQ